MRTTAAPEASYTSTVAGVGPFNEPPVATAAPATSAATPMEFTPCPPATGMGVPPARGTLTAAPAPATKTNPPPTATRPLPSVNANTSSADPVNRRCRSFTGLAPLLPLQSVKNSSAPSMARSPWTSSSVTTCSGAAPKSLIAAEEHAEIARARAPAAASDWTFPMDKAKQIRARQGVSLP